MMLVNIVVPKHSDETGANHTCFKKLDGSTATCLASKHIITAKYEAQLKNVDDRSAPEPSMPLTTSNIQLNCTFPTAKPQYLKPQQFKLKKKLVDCESRTPRTHPGRIELIEDFQPQPITNVAWPMPQQSQAELASLAEPSEHTLNMSPHFYQCSGRHSVFEYEKKQVSQESQPDSQQLRRRIISPTSWTLDTPFNDSKASGYGCFPRSERVSLAPNSKATSTIYKNEYKSLITSTDVNRIANLQKSRMSVNSANSPSRLRALMESGSKSATLLINQR